MPSLGQIKREFKGTLRVASTNGVGALVVHGTFVEVLDAVPLGLDRRRQMAHHHLEQSLMIDQRERREHELNWTAVSL